MSATDTMKLKKGAAVPEKDGIPTGFTAPAGRKSAKGTAPAHIQHPFPPLYNEASRVLILGSFPSVKSREQNFFYGHPQNRFWPLIAELLEEERPESIEEKKALILNHGLALWDSIASCDITGSSDSSIRNVVPNYLAPILETARIGKIFCNGATSHKLYEKYIYPEIGIYAVKLPSTSPANAAWTMRRLKEAWQVVIGE